MTNSQNGSDKGNKHDDEGSAVYCAASWPSIQCAATWIQVLPAAGCALQRVNKAESCTHIHDELYLLNLDPLGGHTSVGTT